jgi:hypothetical protein
MAVDKIAVRQQLLDGSEAEVRLEQVTGEAVAERVGRRSFADPGLPDGFPDRFLYLTFM